MQDGRVLLRRELCTNCGICVLACPFGAIMTTMIIRKIESRDVTNHKESLLGRFLSKQDLSRECQNLLVHKCDGCIEKAGAEKVCPACAATCPSGAIEYRKDISGILYSKRIKAYETYLLIDKTV
jgi:Fe-S-cluster-containing hydrogenase component 2